MSIVIICITAAAIEKSATKSNKNTKDDEVSQMEMGEGERAEV
jgi:hypothetical protein